MEGEPEREKKVSQLQVIDSWISDLRDTSMDPENLPYVGGVICGALEAIQKQLRYLDNLAREEGEANAQD